AGMAYAGPYRPSMDILILGSPTRSGLVLERWPSSPCSRSGMRPPVLSARIALRSGALSVGVYRGTAKHPVSRSVVEGEVGSLAEAAVDCLRSGVFAPDFFAAAVCAAEAVGDASPLGFAQLVGGVPVPDIG